MGEKRVSAINCNMMQDGCSQFTFFFAPPLSLLLQWKRILICTIPFFAHIFQCCSVAATEVYLGMHNTIIGLKLRMDALLSAS